MVVCGVYRVNPRGDAQSSPCSLVCLRQYKIRFRFDYYGGRGSIRRLVMTTIVKGVVAEEYVYIYIYIDI